MKEFVLDEIFESKLKPIVKPLLDQGRPDDWGHTLRAVEYAKYLLQHEEGESEIVIPSLYLHDIGWSKVPLNDFINAPLNQKRQTESAELHMEYGASLAESILKGMGCQDGWVQRIVRIIRIHDDHEKILQMEDPSAILVFEADRLDRFSPESYHRYSQMFGPEFFTGRDKHETLEYFRQGLKIWFKTETAKALAKKLAHERGLTEI